MEDFEFKINQVFRGLEKRNLIVVRSGEERVNLSEQLEEQRGKIGCVCFSLWDESDSSLGLSVRYFGRDSKDTPGIGNIVKEESEKRGLKVDWDGDPGATIRVTK